MAVGDDLGAFRQSEAPADLVVRHEDEILDADVDGTRDVSLARITRAAVAPVELIRPADVQHGHLPEPARQLLQVDVYGSSPIIRATSS